MRQSLLAYLIYCALRCKSFLSARLEEISRCTAGFALATLDSVGRARLTALIYNAKKDKNTSGLFDWELEWFEHDLPPAPAKILLGGAGTGREVEPLITMGYSVLAFDPAQSCVEKAVKKFSHQQCLGFFTGGYEDLLCGDEASGLTTAIWSAAPFDAVILGWGSFTHLSEVETRVALLEKVKKFCPDGPVLLSFWLRDEHTRVERGKAWAWGYRLGELLKLKKGGASTPPAGDDITAHAGYGHFFTMEEMAELARLATYRIVSHPRVAYLNKYPHLTLRPTQ